MNQASADVALILYDGEIELLLNAEDDVNQSDQALFLISIYHRCQEEPAFYKAQLQWIKREMRDAGCYTEKAKH